MKRKDTKSDRPTDQRQYILYDDRQIRLSPFALQSEMNIRVHRRHMAPPLFHRLFRRLDSWITVIASCKAMAIQTEHRKRDTLA